MEARDFSPSSRDAFKNDLEAQIAHASAMCEQLEASNRPLQETLRWKEEMLVLKTRLHGVSSSQVAEAGAILTTSYNVLAMQLCEDEQFPQAHDLLKKAEILTQSDGCLREFSASRLRLRAVTLNNMGCYFKRIKKLRLSLQYLEKALRIEAENPDNAENPAGTHLNACVTLSQLGRHKDALVHAFTAVDWIHKHAKNFSQTEEEESARPDNNSNGFVRNGGRAGLGHGDDLPSNHCQTDAAEPPLERPGDQAHGIAGSRPDDISEIPHHLQSVLAVAYHNMAVEQECLQQYHAAEDSYRKAVATALACWGKENPMYQALSKSLRDFRRKHNQALLAPAPLVPSLSTTSATSVKSSASHASSSSRRSVASNHRSRVACGRDLPPSRESASKGSSVDVPCVSFSALQLQSSPYADSRSLLAMQSHVSGKPRPHGPVSSSMYSAGWVHAGVGGVNRGSSERMVENGSSSIGGGGRHVPRPQSIKDRGGSDRGGASQGGHTSDTRVQSAGRPWMRAGPGGGRVPGEHEGGANGDMEKLFGPSFRPVIAERPVQMAWMEIS
eukprot:jgi/Mesvir1/7098/Mv09205-RA.1